MRLTAFGNGEPPRSLLAATPNTALWEAICEAQKTKRDASRPQEPITKKSARSHTHSDIIPRKDTGSPKAETVEPGRATRPTRGRVFNREARATYAHRINQQPKQQKNMICLRVRDRKFRSPKGNFVCRLVRRPN